jgi:hypothetical protein
MGWTFQDRVPPSIVAAILQLCSGDAGDRRLRPLALARMGTTWYAAVEARFADPAAAQASPCTHSFPVLPDASYVFGAVILTDRDGAGWGYKDMDETMGPVQSQAPALILDRLSATTSANALAWRARCRANLPVRPDEAWALARTVPAPVPTLA